MFLCPSKYLLMGANLSTCTENWKWEPNPRDVECRGKTKILNAKNLINIDVYCYNNDYTEQIFQENQPYTVWKSIIS